MSKNKTKKEVYSDMEKIQAANRMRETIRGRIYPFLLELNDTIGYTKIFLQTAAVALDSAYSERQGKTKVSELLPRLTEIFDLTGEHKAENEKYLRLFDILKDETLSDFASMVETLPRAVETYFTQQMDKHPILEVKIDDILGK